MMTFLFCLQTTPPVNIPPSSTASLPSKVQRQTSGTESREQSEGHQAPPSMLDEATESHGASAVVAKVAAESASIVPPPHPVATEVPVSEETEAQSKLSLRSDGPSRDVTVDVNVKEKLFNMEKVEPMALEDLSITRTLESGGSSASILSALGAGDSQGGQ